MKDWIASDNQKEENNEVFSIAPNEPATKQEQVSQLSTDDTEEKPTEAISRLGGPSSYKIKDVTVSKQESRNFPSVLLALIVVLPVILIFAISAISNRNLNKSEDSFIFNTLESKYFTLNIPPDYEINSIVDKKIPYLEQHTLTTDVDGQKTLTITVKDVKFEYELSGNKEVVAKRDNPNIYQEESYELNAKQGLIFKKLDENFEHQIFLVDRNRSLLYEIRFFSPTNFATDEELAEELQTILKGMTFL